MKKTKTALLVIDMQKVYTADHPWYCEGMEEVLQELPAFCLSFPKEDVFYTAFRYDEDMDGIWREYGERYQTINDDPQNEEIVEELKDIAHPIYCKSAYSCLSNRELTKKLREYDEIILTGVQAEVCVLSTAYGLIDLGKKVVYKRSLIAGRNKEMKEATEKALSSMSPLHVRFID